MRKVIIALLIVASLCNYDFIFPSYKKMVNKNSFGELNRRYSGKSFLQYFYSPESMILFINENNHRYDDIVTLKGNDDFKFTTDIRKVPENQPFVGLPVKPREVPFYFLELEQNNQVAKIFVYPKSKTVHFPTHVPLTFRIQIFDSEYRVISNYKLSVRGDDISLVESVHLVTASKNGDKTQIKLHPDSNNVFTSPALKHIENETNYLEIKIIKGENNQKWFVFENCLQADLHLLDSEITATEIDNKPQYLRLGEVFVKKTKILSYDDFVIEFPQDFVEVTKTTLSKEAPQDLISVVKNQGRIHITHRGRIPENSTKESYRIEIEFVVKALPKVIEPVLIARYDLENLKGTDGFILRGSFYDDKIYFKTSAKTLLENNVYFFFKFREDLTPYTHDISIGYDALPSDNYTRFNDAYKLPVTSKLHIDKQSVKASEIVIISLKRVSNSLKSMILYPTISIVEVKITKDIFRTTEYYSENMKYTLNKGQSIFISNYMLDNFPNSFEYRKYSQDITVNNVKGQVIAYTRKIGDWNYSNLNSFFSFEERDEFSNYKYFEYTYWTIPRYEDEIDEDLEREENFGSLIKITAITDQTTVTIDLKKKGKSFDGLLFFN